MFLLIFKYAEYRQISLKVHICQKDIFGRKYIMEFSTNFEGF